MKDCKTALHFLKTGGYSGAENVAVTIITKMHERYGYRGIYASLPGSIDAVLEKNAIEHAAVNANTGKEYQRIIDFYRPDVIHAHDFGTSVIAAGTKNNAVMISHLHNNPPWLKKIGLRSIAYASAARKFQTVLGVSESVFEEFVFYRSIAAKSIVIGNPVDHRKIIELAFEANEKEQSDVMFLGRLSYPKHPEKFIDIIHRCKSEKPEICAVMAGGGELADRCKNKIRQMGMEWNIHMLGFKSNPYGYLQNTKVLCVPSRYEGFGLAVVEAFALGIPVVAAPVGGMKGLVTDEAGLLSDSLEEMSSEIIRLLHNPSYYRKKSEAALERAVQLDNIDGYLSKLNNIYRGKTDGGK